MIALRSRTNQMPTSITQATEPQSGSWVFVLLLAIPSSIGIWITGPLSLPWQLDSPLPLFCVCGAAFVACAVRAHARNRKSLGEALLSASSLWVSVMLPSAVIVGALMTNQEPPTVWASTNEVILGAVPLREEMRSRFTSGAPLEHIGQGLKSRYSDRYLTTASVTDDGRITLRSSELGVELVMTPAVRPAENGVLAGLIWRCEGNPRRLMPKSCRAPKPWYRFNT